MDFINVLLAKLFDSFKAKNPTIATAIIIFLGAVVYAANNGLGELVGYDFSKVIEYVAIVLGFLQGSRTSAIIAEDKK